MMPARGRWSRHPWHRTTDPKHQPASLAVRDAGSRAARWYFEGGRVETGKVAALVTRQLPTGFANAVARYVEDTGGIRVRCSRHRQSRQDHGRAEREQLWGVCVFGRSVLWDYSKLLHRADG